VIGRKFATWVSISEDREFLCMLSHFIATPAVPLKLLRNQTITWKSMFQISSFVQCLNSKLKHCRVISILKLEKNRKTRPPRPVILFPYEFLKFKSQFYSQFCFCLLYQDVNINSDTVTKFTSTIEPALEQHYWPASLKFG
jgi:hypothetical protein